SDDPTFDELLGRVRRTSLDAFEHQDVPFEKLVMELAPAAANGRSALMQVMFTLQDAELAALRLAGTTFVPFASGRDASKFDLALFVHERAGGLVASLQYRTQLFDAATIDRMLANFETLLRSIVRNPASTLSQLDVLGAAERRSIASRNATAAPYPQTATLDRLIAEQAARTPGATAVEWSDAGRSVGTMTYAALEARAEVVASHLRSLGVGPNVGVGICVARSPELMVGLLGVLKAGGYYVPLDPDYPKERLAYMLEDAALSVLLTVDGLRHVLPSTSHATTVVALDADLPPIEEAARSRDAVEPRAEPDDLAYTIYTSGSTGRPKGVMIPHRAVVNYLTWMQSAYQLRPGEAVLQKAPTSFDASVWELFLPLVAGARLVLAPPGSQGDAYELLATLERHAVEIVQFVPSQLEIVLESTGADGARVLAGLRRLFLGGERLPSELLDRFFAACPEAPITNLYGPTEATVYATYWETDATTWRTDATVSLGAPIANVRIYVIDGSGGPAPLGVVGELCIAGVALARGYHNRPELTAERFLEAGRSGVPGERLYRTGDLARYRADGTLEYLGRSDTQVKLRGYRIELGEIENALAAQPDVQSAVVLIRADGADQQLVAYVIAAAGVTPDAALVPALRARLREALPEYMIPAAFAWVDAWPLNANGKLDRKALAERVAAPLAPSVFVEPRTATETRLADIWTTVMRRERVGALDNFFDLGGHSILAMRIVSRVQEEFGVRISLAVMFDRPTVAEMAVVVDEAERAPALSAPPALARAPRTALRRPIPSGSVAP
ncbi:MAG: amino acid adenylation domain-containing protein, partial [Candidatus Eremiobacteraeota bacterium]|nr:amino acid adenylation domain-containing protein [Candidatus Eremiobacteraeota bacterium]